MADHQRQLETLPGERECRQEEERLSAEIQGLEKACQYRDVDMRATLEKQKKTDAEVSLQCKAQTAGQKSVSVDPYLHQHENDNQEWFFCM